MDLMSYSFVNFVTFLVSTERKCHICDIIVLNKLTLTQSKCISVSLEEFTEYASNHWRKTERSQPVTGWTGKH